LSAQIFGLLFEELLERRYDCPPRKFPVSALASDYSASVR
jgi:hypothetical protein